MTGLKDLEKFFKCLANRKRLQIINFLVNKEEASVSDIAEHINLSFKSTSKHLSMLRNLNIVDNRKQSTIVFYSLSNPLPFVVKTNLKSIADL